MLVARNSMSLKLDEDDLANGSLLELTRHFGQQSNTKSDCYAEIQATYHNTDNLK